MRVDKLMRMMLASYSGPAKSIGRTDRLINAEPDFLVAPEHSSARKLRGASSAIVAGLPALAWQNGAARVNMRSIRCEPINATPPQRSPASCPCATRSPLLNQSSPDQLPQMVTPCHGVALGFVEPPARNGLTDRQDQQAQCQRRSAQASASTVDASWFLC